MSCHRSSRLGGLQGLKGFVKIGNFKIRLVKKRSEGFLMRVLRRNGDGTRSVGTQKKKKKKTTPLDKPITQHVGSQIFKSTK